MRRSAKFILVLLAFLLMVGSCGRKARVIPMDKFAKIYEDMFIADEWLSFNTNQRKKADTTWFYDPIFERYGYNREDYFLSVEYYLRDPGEYAKIFQKVKASLDTQRVAISKAYALMNLASLSSCVVPLYSKTIAEFKYTDRIHLNMGSNGVYELVEVIPDTTFNGPRMIVTKRTEKPEEVPSDESTVAQDDSSIQNTTEQAPGRNVVDEVNEMMRTHPEVIDGRVDPSTITPSRRTKHTNPPAPGAKVSKRVLRDRKTKIVEEQIVSIEEQKLEE